MLQFPIFQSINQSFPFSFQYDSDEEEISSTKDPSYMPSSKAPASGASKNTDINGSDDEEDSRDSYYSPSSPSEKTASNSKANSRTNFTNALLKVGTKSTKDSSLDKPVRKGAGLLLEAAGRSLLQKASTQNTLGSGGNGGTTSNLLSGGATIGGLSFGLASSKISFGLYGGHLAVDDREYTKSNNKTREKSGASSDNDNFDTSDNNDSDNFLSSSRTKVSDSVTKSSSTTSSSPATKSVRPKVFSNWGGEFFKKNLDYRANTNKIMEKMNLTTGSGKNNGENSSATSGGSGGGSSSGFMSMMKNNSSKRPFEGSSNSNDSANSPTKRLKTSFLNSYS